MAYIHRAGIVGIYHPFCIVASSGRDEEMSDMYHTVARCLDRQADAELNHGHHAAAERLAHRAAEMRERAV